MSPRPEGPGGVLGLDRFVLSAAGRSVRVARARRCDAPRIRKFYRGLSIEASYSRFFAVRRELPAAELNALVDPDDLSVVTMLAWMGERLVGIGEMHGTSDAPDAEVAFVVSDDHHDEGIATILLEDLAVIGRSMGLHRLTAETLTGNRAMQLVFRTAGLDQRQHFDGSVIEVAVDLDDLSALAAAARMRQRASIRASLLPFFEPARVVIVGDASDPTGIARRALTSMRSTFGGQLTIIDPTGRTNDEVLSALHELGSPAELAVVATTPARTLTTLELCSRAGTHAALVLSAHPTALVQTTGRLRPIAHRLGMRILGPSVRFQVGNRGLLVADLAQPPVEGTVAVVATCANPTAAASIATAMVQRGIGASAFVGSDPNSDVDLGELLVWWSMDDRTDVVLVACDEVPIDHGFRRSARMAARAKPIIVLSGDAAVGSDHLDDDGLIRVGTLEGLLDHAEFHAGMRCRATTTEVEAMADRLHEWRQSMQFEDGHDGVWPMR